MTKLGVNGYQMLSLIIILSASLAAFAFLMIALLLVQRYGKARSRCACRRAEEVLKRYDAIHKTDNSRRDYNPATVDPASLPVVSGSPYDRSFDSN